MSGKKNKESRRVKVGVVKIAKQALLEVEAERNRLTPLVIEHYNKAINKLPLRKRIIICWNILWGDA